MQALQIYPHDQTIATNPDLENILNPGNTANGEVARQKSGGDLGVCVEFDRIFLHFLAL